ncbi:MAG: hypothetical protein AAB541_01615 [Patescibacteria group bacterium]
MDPEAFLVMSVDGVEEVVIARPDYDPSWVHRGWQECGRGITLGPVALEDITVAGVIGEESENA